MAYENFTLWDSETFDNSSVTGNGVYLLSSSPIISNSSGLSSLRVVVEYETTTPPSNSREFGLRVVVEGSDGAATNTKWFPIAYQFEEFVRDIKGKTREIIMQPNLAIFDLGLDDTIPLGFDTGTRISRQNGQLGSEFRACLYLNEYGYGTAGAFQSTTISGYGERFSV